MLKEFVVVQEYLEQKACSTVLIGRHAKKPLGVEHDGLTFAIVRSPHSGCARRLEMRRLEHLGTMEQGMIQCVRLAVAGVSEDRHHLYRSVDVAAESTNELVFVSYLQGKCISTSCISLSLSLSLSRFNGHFPRFEAKDDGRWW